MRPRDLALTVLLATYGMLFQARPSHAHTGIGSGGDVVIAFLEESRNQLRQAMRIYLQTADAERPNLCRGLALSAAQRADCNLFLQQTAAAVNQLHDITSPVVFTLSDTPLYVVGPDGKQTRVAAETLTGPDGAIYFDYERIEGMSPRELVALLLHESGHKVRFAAVSDYVGDNAPVLSFPTGRRLLESAGLAVAEYARQQGLIGDAFGIKDRFDCALEAAQGQAAWHVGGTDEREFLPNRPDSTVGPFQAFESGIGPDRGMNVSLAEVSSRLVLHLLMHEEHGCLGPGSSATRYVDLSIWREFNREAGVPQQPPTQLAAQRLSGWNPACEEDAAKRHQAMAIAFAGYTFSCMYLGEEAQTKATPGPTLKGINASDLGG